jgi:cell wall-associated NlpC family hydrolase
LFVRRTLLRCVLIGAAAVTLVAPATAALADPTPAQVQAQIDKGNSDVELIVEQYNKVNDELTATQAALAALQTKLVPLQSNMDTASANVSKIAVTAYQTGSSLQTWSLLLSDRSTDNFMDQVATLRQISQSQQHQIDTYTATKKSVDAESKRLNDLLAAQTAQKADLVAKRTKIEGDIARLDALQKKLTAQAAAANHNNGNTKAPTTNPTAPPTYGPPPAVSGSAGKAVSYAWAQLNKRYVWGAAGPNAFDCSGLTMMAWRAAGVSLPHNAAGQYHAIKHITRSQLVPGDLVFYNGLGHVGIYIGNNQIIHAPNSRTVVKVSPVDMGDPLYGFGRP